VRRHALERARALARALPVQRAPGDLSDPAADPAPERVPVRPRLLARGADPRRLNHGRNSAVLAAELPPPEPPPPDRVDAVRAVGLEVDVACALPVLDSKPNSRRGAEAEEELEPELP